MGKKKGTKTPELCRECGSGPLQDLGSAFIRGKGNQKNWYKKWKCLNCGVVFKQWLGVK